MESKVLQGEAQGGLSELARRQEEVLRSQQQQLQRQRSKDAAKLRQIADMEEAALMAQGKYSSLQARACCLLALLLPFGLPTHPLLLPFGMPTQGSTGVLKTSRLPTWVVNFGVGFAHPKILLDAVLRGQPTCHNFFVRASIFALDCTCSC